MTKDEIAAIEAEYDMRIQDTYIPDIPRSPAKTTEFIKGEKHGFSMGLYAGKTLMLALMERRL